MANYTTNLVTNPSFQLGTLGYLASGDAQISLDSDVVLYGTQSLLVSTAGNGAGEGCQLPSVFIDTGTLISCSVFLQGSGSVFVSVNSAGNVIASVPVTLTSAWQRVVINQISATPGETVTMFINTTSTQKINFLISGVQVEPESPAHPYCDGDQIGCYWSAGFGSPSYQPNENPTEAVSNDISFSNVVVVLQQGAASSAIPISYTDHSYSSLISISSAGPVAALTNFGIFELTDPDPAQSYAGWNTAGSNTGSGGSYTRNWGTFFAPLDFIASNNQKVWSRAAFMSAGWQFANVLNNGTINITRVQTEILPITTGFAIPSPTAYDAPREIHSIIKPDRLNYCTNPSIEVNTTGWSAVGTGSIAKDGTVSAGNIIEFDDKEDTAGTSSLKITVNANGDGAQISLSNLIAGDTYTVSAYVQADEGLANITMSCGSGTTSVLSSGGTGYGTPEYGGGPYGGRPAGIDLATGTWFRIDTTFVAPSSTTVLQFIANAGLDTVYPTHFWIDAVLCEPGETLSFYFDGSFGTNYSWESTSGLSRSYYYDQKTVKQQGVLNILNHHLPMGISYATPLYSIPPTQ